MKKNSVLLRVGVAAMVLTLATTSLMSGTLAKYTSEGTGVAEAIVAKWDPQMSIGGKNISTTSATFNLTETQVSGKDNKLVASNRIAPGMSGSIPIEIDPNGMEVDYQYTMYISYKLPSGADMSVIPTNLVFKVGDTAGAGTAIVPGPEETPAVLAQANTPIKASTGKVTKYLNWEWAYETGSGSSQIADQDITDTGAGNAAASAASSDLAKVQYTVEIVITQADGTVAS